MQGEDNRVPSTRAGALQAPLARLPVVLLQVRDKAAQQLREALQVLFANADDTLFEMSDRASGAAEQALFFEAMRELRLKRNSIERAFIDKFYDSFLILGQYQAGESVEPGPVSFDQFELVHTDNLEKSMAVDAMVAAVGRRDGLALGQLTVRLNEVLAQAMNERNNPLGPTMLCDFFLQAGRSLGVVARVKLVLLRLFEKYVLADAERLYGAANRLLIEAGILPQLQSVPMRRATDHAAEPLLDDLIAPGGSDASDPSQQEVFAAMQETLSQLRGSPATGDAASDGGQPISSQDLLRLLSHLQQAVPHDQAVADFDLRRQLDQLLARVSVKSGKSRIVGSVDEDVINLVTLLFEFMLDDRNLSPSLRNLIGRLQIPMLKVAVLDKSFFNRGTHPARRLLNEIAAAALGWGGHDDYRHDALYLRIEQIVQRLLDDFVDDTAIFAELLADFLAFTSEERRRSELLEQRTRDAEQGRARAEQARQRVQQELNRRLVGKTLPQVVVRLLQEAWSKVLLLTCLRHGEDSAQWQAGLDAVDQLIWSVEPHPEPQACQRLLELVPGLLKVLREGLSSAAFDPFATSEFFSQLEVLHMQAFQQVSRSTPQGSAESASMVDVVEEIVLIAPQEQLFSEPSRQLPEDDAGLRKVGQLRVGCWVELQEDEEHRLRCKLAAIVEPGGRYIFVNRTGMKVLEKTRLGLAMEFRRGAIHILDDTLLFDRALESVIGNLNRQGV